MNRWSGVLMVLLLAVSCAGSPESIAGQDAALTPEPQPAPTDDRAVVPATPLPVATSAQPTAVPSVTVEPRVAVPKAVVPEHEGLRHLASSADDAFHYYAHEDAGWSPLSVDRGAGVEPAMSDPQDRYFFGQSPAFEIDVDGIVTFVHEASGSYQITYLGRLDDQGVIRDVHVKTDGAAADAFIYDPVDLELDLTSPLLASAIRTDATVAGWWYRGATLSDAPGCGNSTLYADDADGYRRVLPNGVELDTVVEIHASPMRWSTGVDASAMARSLVFSTVCPEQHDGVRLVLGTEALHGGEGSDAPGQARISIDPTPLTFPNGEVVIRRVLELRELDEMVFGFGPTQIITVEHLAGDIVTVAISEYGAVIETVDSDYHSDEVDEVGLEVIANPIEIERLIYPYVNELPPSDVAILEHAGGEPTLAVIGHRSVQVLTADGLPTSRMPAATYGQNAFLTSVVAFGDSFIVAIGGEEAASPLLPELMRWNTGARTWVPLTTSITLAASHRSESAPVAAASSASTPPSPPFGGGTAIMDMVVYNDIIWAVGWATVDGEIRTALWKSADGSNWVLEVVPTLGSGVEYAQSLSVNDLGVMVNVGNWTHYGAGILARAHGEHWSTLPFPTTNDATSVAGAVASVGSRAWVIERFIGESSATISWSDDFEDWTSVDLPAGDVGTFWSLDPDHAQGPVAWNVDHQWGSPHKLSYGWQWHSDLGRFITAPVPGLYVASAAGYVVTQDLGYFVVMRAAQADD